MLLRIRSAHLEILGFPMVGANKHRGILRGLKLWGESKTYQVVLVIQEENSGVTMQFLEILKLQFGKRKRHTLLCILLLLE